MIQKGSKCAFVVMFSKGLFCSGRRQYTTASCLRGQQSKLSLPRCCEGPDALLPEAVRPRPTVHQVVHSTEGAMVLIIAHEGMKTVVLRDVGDVHVSP